MYIVDIVTYYLKYCVDVFTRKVQLSGYLSSNFKLWNLQIET